MSQLIAIIIALSVTMFLIPTLIRNAERLRLIDAPSGRKLHSGRIPRVGGIAMIIGTILAVWLAKSEAPEMLGIVVGMVVIMIFGIWDDRFELDYRIKLVGQLLAALIAVLGGPLLVERVPFWDSEALPMLLALPFTILCLLAITNAVNLSDGLDGLAGGTMLLTYAALAILAHLAGDAGVVVIAVASAASILGFLRYNVHPARAFMGDAGSQFLGFTAGALCIAVTQRVHPVVSSALPLFLLGLPILDTILVMSQRIAEGRSPFSPDRNHVHHKLLALGFDHYESVLIIYAVHATLVTSGLFFRYESDALLVGLYVGFCLSVVTVFRWAERSGWRFQRRSAGERGTLVFTGIAWLRSEKLFEHRLSYYLAFAVFAYFIVVGLQFERLSHDIALVAAVLFVVLAATFFDRHDRRVSTVEKAALYVMAVWSVFHSRIPTESLIWAGILDKVFFGILGLSVVLGAIDCSKKRFEITALDFLVLFIVLMTPFVPREYFEPIDQPIAVVKVIVLLYSIELILYRFARHRDLLRLASMVCIGVVAVRGLL